MVYNIDASDKTLYNEVYLKYLSDYTKDLLIFYGGASSGKSKFVAQRNILNILKGGRNYLICRKVSNSIRNTVYSEYKKAIYDFGFLNLFRFNDTEMFILCNNGYKMVFKGLDNPEKLKSLIFEKGILTDIHIEESTDINENDFNQLQLRLRGKSGYKKQIIMSFNPISQLHWIKRRFFDNINDKINILKTTYKDNRFLTKQDVETIESYKDIDKYYYDVYALGNWGVLGNLVFTNWSVENLSEIKDQFNTYYYGLDFGFTNDPTAIIKVAVKDNKVYILNEHFEKGLTNDQIAKVFKEHFGKGYVYCDSAEPKSIQELKNLGVGALSAIKGKDSVRHGIQWLKQKKIIVDSSCRNFINELQTYKYREDKDGNVLNEPVDINNHGIDATRYALCQLMRNYQALNLSLGDLGI